jgi:hypothetical protein
VIEPSNSAHEPVSKLEAPIVVIGNGGSGSSLLDRMLDAHPGIAMKGEMKFILPRIWANFWEADANSKLRNLEAHFKHNPGLEHRVAGSPAEYQRFMQALEQEEFRRTAAVLRQTFDAWFLLSAGPKRFWGFKEIMNGGADFYAWDIYDLVFPQAFWVHVLRHPLHQIRAQARLSNLPLTSKTAEEFLNLWFTTVQMSRKRALTGRYVEIRYEDLIQAPQHTLTPLFHKLDLQWHEQCRAPLTRQWGSRSEHSALPTDINQIIPRIGGLEECLIGLGYVAKGETVERLLPEEPNPFRPKTELLGADTYRLSGAFYPEHGMCWEFDFTNTALSSTLVAIADCNDFPKRSPLRLFENGRPLGPGHALHFYIRGAGKGAFSHWRNQLLFSTSDNSDPNSNGRTYSFDLKG